MAGKSLNGLAKRSLYHFVSVVSFVSLPHSAHCWFVIDIYKISNSIYLVSLANFVSLSPITESRNFFVRIYIKNERKTKLFCCWTAAVKKNVYFVKVLLIHTLYEYFYRKNVKKEQHTNFCKKLKSIVNFHITQKQIRFS